MADPRSLRRAWDWFVLDPTGQSTLLQPPNLPISVFWCAAGLLVIVRPTGVVASALAMTAGGALAWWATDELTSGTSPFRRSAGAVTLAGMTGMAGMAGMAGRRA